MSSSNHETEIKLSVDSPDAGRRLLRRAGFRVHRRRLFENNIVYDTAGLSLRSRAELLRLRQCGSSVLLTYKGPPEAGPHKSREELETTVASFATFEKILARLGYAPVFRYEKYRTEYQRPGEEGIATLDETPIGTFLELEGRPYWIDRCAGQLGFNSNQYITASYAKLYIEMALQERKNPRAMIFRS